ncbi:MAG: hypothetical protein JWL62_3831 [Hyphomicrobiales bacterium]|nr:hypothetical protein [Hyphomicrobiales bacterium]
MPRNGSATLSDLRERGLTTLDVTCPKCDRRGEYPVANLIARLGEDFILTAFLTDLTADCHRRIAGKFADQCGAQFLGLAGNHVT